MQSKLILSGVSAYVFSARSKYTLRSVALKIVNTSKAISPIFNLERMPWFEFSYTRYKQLL